MNIETVNELITSLESAGELSIREQKFLKLAKEFRICSASLDAAIKTGNMLADQNSQLAAENVGLKAVSIKLYNHGYLNGHQSTVEGYFVDIHRNDIDSYHEDVVAEIIEDETPATSAYMAGIKADEAKLIFQSILDNPAVTDLGSLVDWLEQHANDSAAAVRAMREGAK